MSIKRNNKTASILKQDAKDQTWEELMNLYNRKIGFNDVKSYLQPQKVLKNQLAKDVMFIDIYFYFFPFIYFKFCVFFCY